jgi:CheY-like chemotaxis protein
MDYPKRDDIIYVHGDRTRIKQVMINLLSNAIKYNGIGGTVTVQCAGTGKERVRVSVSDTGAGLPPDQVAQLFQPFNRLGQHDSGEEGTGIGLVVTKQLVELMGGEIGVDSVVGKGTVFWVEFAASAAPALALENIDEDTLERRQALSLQAGDQPTMLYVEDNPANLALVEQLIARRGDLKLLTAIDAPLGIELARAYLPDVILMDINLPGMSGYGALKRLREDPATAHIPVLALSANAMPRDIEKGLEAGFFRYLTKPIRVHEFMSAVDLALLHAASSSPLQPAEHAQ